MTEAVFGKNGDRDIADRARRVCVDALCQVFGTDRSLSADGILAICRSIGLDANEALIRECLGTGSSLAIEPVPTSGTENAAAPDSVEPVNETTASGPTAKVSDEEAASKSLAPKPLNRQLYAWQAEALRAWQAQDCRGIVEAVTGSGKTTVGIEAAREALGAGGKLQVLVPTVALQEQWHSCLQENLPGCRIGLIGGKSRPSPGLKDNDAVVVVVNTGRSLETGPLPAASLLIGDECHRYGTGFNAQALNPNFPHRLGLTATSERRDEGNDEFVFPYFGNICYRLSYAQALSQNVTAHFRVALVGVGFATHQEKADYDRLGNEKRDIRNWLEDHQWTSFGSTTDFYTEVFSLAISKPRRRGEGDAEVAFRKAMHFVYCHHRQRELVGDTVTKRHALIQLTPAIAKAERVLVFTDTVRAAEHAADCLRSQDIAAEDVTSSLHPNIRKQRLERFCRGELKALTAPRILDEGIDIPDADLAFVFCGTKTRRQMVQRMGRVLRRKPDGRLARFVVFYVKNTHEDPACGAHEEFLEEIVSVADTAINLHIHPHRDDIVSFLNNYESPVGQGMPRVAEEVSQMTTVAGSRGEG
jgi:RNA polymerase primary sigma factor